MKKIIVILILILFIGNVFAEEFYPTTISELNAIVTLKGNGTITNLPADGEVNFQTLTFQQTDFQKIKLIHEELYINGKTIYPQYIVDESDNKYVNFIIKENGEFYYELKAEIENTAIVHDLTDYNIPKEYPLQIQDYLLKSQNIENDSKEILTVASNKLLNNNFIDTLNETIYWVNDYVEYATNSDFQRYYLLQESAIKTLLNKKGVCDEFANLGAALLRAKNIPTKITVGITFDGKKWGNHAWIEAYHKDFGWIPSDPTFRETGFVDATHIKLGSFKDVTNSLSKATFPKSANVIFQTQTIETLPIIDVISKKYFSHATITSENNIFKTNKWNDLQIKVTNNTNGLLTIPTKIIYSGNSIPIYTQENDESIGEIIFDEKTKSIQLNSGQTGTINFKVYPNITLENNQILKGSILLYSLSEPHEINFEIQKDKSENNGEVSVKDVVPIIMGDKLKFLIELSNTLSNQSTVKIQIDNNTWTQNMQPFTAINLSYQLPLKEEAYNLAIETQTQIYTQQIMPAIIEIVPVQETKKTVVIQQINTDNNENFVEKISGNPQIIILALLPALALVILIVFSTKKRYI